MGPSCQVLGIIGITYEAFFFVAAAFASFVWNNKLSEEAQRENKAVIVRQAHHILACFISKYGGGIGDIMCTSVRMYTGLRIAQQLQLLSYFLLMQREYTFFSLLLLFVPNVKSLKADVPIGGKKYFELL